MYGMGYGLYDPTIILVLIGMVISMVASAFVQSTFNKYNRVQSERRVSGTDAAKYILKSEQIHGVSVRSIQGNLTDNYNSHTKVLSLSEATADVTSVAAIGVAAHECGHAVQDEHNYLPLRLRAAIFPVVNFGSRVSMPLILIGLMLQGPMLVKLGILAFSLTFLFQVVTLPVEFNASKRALQILREGNLVTEEELPLVRKVLFAAALTYVAAAITTLLQLARLIILFGNNNRRN